MKVPTIRALHLLSILLATACHSTASAAQADDDAVNRTETSTASETEVADNELDPKLFAGLQARSIGPAGMSGRVAAIDVVASNPDILYVGAATGGLWKSEDGALSFKPIFDDQNIASIGAIAIAQASPEVIWVGTGEGNLRNSMSVGNGIYRSVDAGETWVHLGLEESEHIHRIVVHPDDPDVAYVAALGKAWGDHEQRGVFRTRDGGATWDKLLYIDEGTGCSDLIMDPRNPDKLFASMWSFRREPHFFRSGGESSGLYVSRDGGDNWEELTEDDGLPKGELGRIGLAISPSHPEVVYALVEAKKSALLRSSNGGRSFKTVNTEEGIASRPFYYGDIRVDPKDPDRIYSLQTVVTVSDDAGKSFRTLVQYNKVHPDHHAFWIHPEDPEFLIDGSDGGIAVSRDHGKSWRFATNLPLAQFYHIAVDNEVPYNVLGGLQDNGSWRGPSEVWENSGIRNHHWREVGFGDGFDTLPDPTDATRGYAMSQEGWLMRWNSVTGERKSIRPPAPLPVEDSEAEDGETIETKLRFNWNAAIEIDPFEPNTIYFGSQFVHRSKDRGDSWEIVSEDLTSNNPEWQKQLESGGLTLDVTGAENYTSLTSLGASPVEQGVLWAGSDDGRIHVSRDGGNTWASVESNLNSQLGVPQNTWVPHIEPSKFDGSSAFVVLDDHRRSNWETYVARTDDYGATWTDLSTDELWGYALSFEQDPVNPSLLFLGTEFGLWVSLDAGAQWFQWKHGLPTVAVSDLVVHPREHDLVIATHGRAAYVLDSIVPLRNLSEEARSSAFTFLSATDAIDSRRRQVDGNRFAGDSVFRGENPRRGASFSYWLNAEDIEAERKRARAAAKKAEKEAEEAASQEDTEAETESGESETSTDEDEADDDEEKEDEEDEKPKLIIEIFDSEGVSLRTLKPDMKLGLNRSYWDLRQRAGRRPSFDSDSDSDDDRPGLTVLPGNYEAKFSFGELTASASIEVLPDPRVAYDADARVARMKAQLKIQAMFEQLADMAQRTRDINTDLDHLKKLIERSRKRHKQSLRASGVELEDAKEQSKDLHKDLSKAIKDYAKSLKDLRQKVAPESDKQGIVRRQGFLSELWSVSSSLSSSWDAPNGTQREQLGVVGGKLTKLLEEAEVTFQGLEELREQVRSSDLKLL